MYSLGYFTDAAALEIMKAPKSGTGRPAALHIEAQNVIWALVAEGINPGEKPRLTRHGEFCTRILSDRSSPSPLWDTGFLDIYCHQKRRIAFLQAAHHPDIRVISISSQEKRLPSFGYRDYRDLSRPVVFKAAGNEAENWSQYRAGGTLSGEVYMPGYMRIGEALSSGEVYSGSQASGPAFICDHPRDVKSIMGNISYFPSREDVETFVNWARGTVPDDYLDIVLSYVPPVNDLEVFYGTSASAPHAGAMVMRHSASMKGITAYDIVPVLLMSAQCNPPPPQAKRLVETQSGMIVDPFHYGHGILVEECFQQGLEDLWDIRAASGRSTQNGEYSGVHTVEGKGYMSARTDKAQGPVVNTVVELSFYNNEANPDVTDARIPEYIMLQSPQGTLIHLPLLIDRKKQYGSFVRAGFQTSAFFGEDISKGEWRIAHSRTSENSLPIASMKIIAHTMHPKSPANVLLKGFQKAVRAEKAEKETAPVTAPSLVPRPA